MRTIVMFSSILFCSALARAEAPSQRGQAGPDASFTFEDDVVLGASYDPDLERVLTHGRARRSSLIEVKRSLIPELLVSVENL